MEMKHAFIALIIAYFAYIKPGLSLGKPMLSHVYFHICLMEEIIDMFFVFSKSLGCGFHASNRSLSGKETLFRKNL